MMRALQAVLLLAAAAGTILAAGCGEEEPLRPSGPIVISIRSGYWAMSDSVRFVGPDSCLARPDSVYSSTEILCNVVLGGPFFTDCDMETAGGDSIIFDCTVQAELGLCYQYIDIAGAGTVNATTYDLVSTLSTRLGPKEDVTLEDCYFFYANQVDACTAMIHLEGAFAYCDSTVEETCGGKCDSSAVFETLLGRSVMTAVEGILTP